MSVVTILLIAAGVAFLLEAFGFVFGTLRPKWWALGVALYLFSLAVG